MRYGWGHTPEGAICRQWMSEMFMATRKVAAAESGGFLDFFIHIRGLVRIYRTSPYLGITMLDFKWEGMMYQKVGYT